MAQIGAVPSEALLRQRALSPVGVLAQSVAQIAPSAAAATSVAIIAGSAGNGGWLTWVICACALLLVAYGIVRLSGRFATTGGLYGLAARSWGPIGGVLAGGGLAIVNGIAAIPALTIGFSIYFITFLGQLGVPDSRWLFAILLAANLAAAAWFAYHDIRLSARVLLVLEIATMGVIAVLLVIVLVVHRGGILDGGQLTLKGASPHGIFLGLVLAYYSFGGFESSTSLGQEAQRARRTIPFAVLASVIIVGVFYVFNSYVQPLGFQGSGHALTSSSAPLSDLSRIAGVPAFQFVINLGVSASMFSCTLAIFNSTCRMWFTLARDGVMPRVLARTHVRERTPHLAVMSLCGASVVILIVAVLTGARALDLYGYMGTMAGFGFLLAYFAVTIGSMVYFTRQRDAHVQDYVFGIVAVLVLLAAFVFSVYPFPEFPYNLIVLCFAGFVIALLIAYGVGRARFPRWLASLGASVDADTARADAAPSAEEA